MSNRSARLIVALIALEFGLAGCDYFVSTEARIHRAEQHLSAGEYRAAMIDLRTVLEKEPDNTAALLLSAELNLQLGDTQAAAADLRHAADRGAPRTPRSAILSAQIRVASGDSEWLLKDIDAGTSLLEEPQRALYRGEALTALGRMSEAEQAFKAALARDSRLNDAHLGFAIVMAAHGQYPEAERSLASALENGGGRMSMPHIASALALLAEVRLAQGNVDGAADSQKKLAGRSPDAVMTRFLGARIALLRRDYQNAVVALQVLANDAPDFAPGQRLLGAALLAQSNLLLAESQLQSYIARWPNDIDGRKLLAQVELRLNEPEKARKALASAPDADASNSLLSLAALDAGTGHGDAAVEDLEKLLKVDPKSSRAELGLAQLAIRRGDLDDARRRLQKLRSADSKAVEARLMLAAIDLRSSHAAEADEVLDEALRAAPDRADVSNAVGRLYLRVGRYDDALAKFRTAVEKDSARPEFWLDLGRAHAALNQLAAAQSAVERSLTLKPDWVPAAELLTRVDLSLGRNDAAVQRVAALSARHPKDPAALALEGETRFATKQYAEAAQRFEAAARIRPSVALAIRIYQTRHLAHAGDETGSLVAWLRDHPRDAFVRVLLAGAYMESGMDREAIGEYEQIVGDNPRNVIALNNLAGLYDVSKDPRALATAKRAFELAPKNPAIADTYGWIAFKSGGTSQALEILAAAATTAKDAPDIQYHYAAALARSGDLSRSVALLKKTLAGGRPFDGRADAEELLKKLVP